MKCSHRIVAGCLVDFIKCVFQSYGFYLLVECGHPFFYILCLRPIQFCFRVKLIGQDIFQNKVQFIGNAILVEQVDIPLMDYAGGHIGGVALRICLVVRKSLSVFLADGVPGIGTSVLRA